MSRRATALRGRASTGAAARGVARRSLGPRAERHFARSGRLTAQTQTSPAHARAHGTAPRGTARRDSRRGVAGRRARGTARRNAACGATWPWPQHGPSRARRHIG
eukprot:512022-Pyramimonas_sp.AAC.1